MKKITLSIGIPAFNEEANIKYLLEALLNQETKNYLLKEIIVVSDHSSDQTNQIVKSFKEKSIRLLINKKRMGQSFGQEKIISIFSGDLLILLNADVLPASQKFIDYMVEPFLQSKKIGLVSPQMVPVAAKTFFEKLINFSVACRESMLGKWNEGDNLLHCQGAARAFSRDLAKKIKWPSAVGEDAYTYFLCITNGYKFKHQKKAKLLYKSPDNISDYKKQSTRFISSQSLMSKLFDKKLVESSYQIPLFLKIKGVTIYFFKNPFFWVIYALTFLSMYLLPRAKTSSSLWEVSKSSKELKII